MATHITIRPPDGDRYDLAIDGSHFAEPASVEVTETLDTAHLWALPGLADAHAHLTMTSTRDIAGISEEQMATNLPKMAWAHVDRGVLLILDKGANTDLSLTALDHDADLRPEVEVAGAIIHPQGGYMPGFGVEVEPDDLVEYVRTSASTRGGWVKIVADWPRKGVGPVSNYTVDQLSEAVDVVHRAGARVAVHTMAFAASDAVGAGVDSIEHGPFLTPDDLGALAARGGAWVPTVVNMLDVLDMLGPDSSGGKLFARGLATMRENLPIAEELGVTVLAGTDMAVPHGEVSIEAARLHEYGLTARAAVRAASTNAYEYTGHTKTLAPGSVADVVFFDENPYEDVAVLQHPRIIVRRGTVIRSS